MEFWHLINRGVDKREVVCDDRDRVRFIHDLYAFNDTNSSFNFEQPQRASETSHPQRTPLLRLHAFCLMKNHYHLLVSEIMEGSIPLFMKKLNMGYAKYFNERHGRTGALWQGKYRRVHITRDAHFLYIPYYIHLNPLDYFMPEWRRGEIRHVQKALAYLEGYRWSSHVDYLGIRNFPSVTHRKELSMEIGSRNAYEKTIASIISDSSLAGESMHIELKD